MRPLTNHDRLFRLLHVEVRTPDGKWKRMIGDELLTGFDHGVSYELKVRHPELSFGFGIGGSDMMVPEKVLPLRD